MKAKDWKFKQYLPDSEDVEAGCKASEAYFSLPPIKGRNEVEELSDAFHSGFMRGKAWAAAKLSNDEIVKLNDGEKMRTMIGRIKELLEAAKGDEGAMIYCFEVNGYSGEIPQGNEAKRIELIRLALVLLEKLE